jgi:hypothetical protein
MFQHYLVILRELVIKIMTNKCTTISQIITLLHVSTLSCYPWLQGSWEWHDSVEKCRSVITYEITVHLLVVVQKISSVIFRCDVIYVSYMKNIVLGDVMSCRVAEIYQGFGWTSCLHLQSRCLKWGPLIGIELHYGYQQYEYISSHSEACSPCVCFWQNPHGFRSLI